MRIAFFSEVYWPMVSGVARTLERTVAALTARGHAVRVYTATYPLPAGTPDLPEVHRSPSRPLFLSPEVQWAFPRQHELQADLAAQPNLLREKYLAVLRPPKYQVEYRWQCLASTCGGHTHNSCDWEVGAAAINFAQRYPAAEVPRHLELKFGEQILGDDKALQQELRDDRKLIPNFVEECLRLEAPVKGDFRLAKVPVDIAGVHIPAGTQVMVLNAAINRDPRKFENPNVLDPRRANARTHVAFGRGPHTCPGAPLARAESVVAFNRLFDRTSDIRISEAHHGPAGARRYNYVPTFILRGLTSLHIEFDPADGVS